jgi:4-hydroxy-4-methyl-2-oxoglutarate aldolase
MQEDKIALEPISRQLINRFKTFSAATVYEAFRENQVLPQRIRPLSEKFKLCGSAITVKLPPCENLMLHKALYVAQPGDVIVADADGFDGAGAWGEIMTIAAQKQEIAGLVFNGAVRDRDEILALDFPVFCLGLCIKGTKKTSCGWINQQLFLGDASILPGDLVLGDCDGIVVVKRKHIEEVLELAEKRIINEREIKNRLLQGETTLSIYNF